LDDTFSGVIQPKRLSYDLTIAIIVAVGFIIATLASSSPSSFSPRSPPPPPCPHHRHRHALFLLLLLLIIVVVATLGSLLTIFIIASCSSP
jgi:hypothetical protein